VYHRFCLQSEGGDVGQAHSEPEQMLVIVHFK